MQFSGFKIDVRFLISDFRILITDVTQMQIMNSTPQRAYTIYRDN